VDKPDVCDVRRETGDPRKSATACSVEAQDLMRANAPGQTRPVDLTQTGRPVDFPPALTLQDRSSNPSELMPNAALKQQTAVLFNPNASPEQKLACIQTLCDAGLKELAYRDQSGNHMLRLEKIPVGESGRSMVHLFGTDENDQQRTILRGISQTDGNFSNEQNQQGQAVDFYGLGKGLLDRANNPDVFIPNQNMDARTPQNQNGDVRNPNELYCPSPYDSRSGVENGYPNNNGREQYSGDSDAWRRSNPFDKNYDPRYAQSLDGNSQRYDPSDPRYNPNPHDRNNSDPRFAPNLNDRNNSDPRFAPNLNDRNNSDPRFAPNPNDRNADPRLVPNLNNRNADSRYNPNPSDQNPGERPTPYRRNPSDQIPYNRNDAPPNNSNNSDNLNKFSRSASDRNNFYAHQNDGNSCSAFSMAMMSSDWNTGRPPSDSESSNWKQIAGTIGHGYRGSLNQVASNLKEGIPGLETKVYNYGMGRVGPNAMQDLNRELAQGHTAVAKVINPHTGNAHYIYIAGRSANGDYVLGDPDRKNPHQQPISGDRLMHMMSARDGFVAGWKNSQSGATRVQGSAANRFAMAHQQLA
jgi:hypothetical protein